MANFTVPFSEEGDRRAPSDTERELGFLCGDADRKLFNWLIHRLESEMGAVMDYAGTPQTDTSFDGLLLAILELISSATGGNPAGYVLMTQARARLKIYPEIETTDGKIPVITPSTGLVRLPGGYTFTHRGIFPITTVQTDFATDPSKIYHLRWSAANGFQMRDLANLTYNPTSVADANEIFDSSFDDMLIARVVTNSSNVPTITNLVNKDRIRLKATQQGVGTIVAGGDGNDGIIYANTLNYNWARTPINVVSGWTGHNSANHYLQGFANRVESEVTTRYGSTVTIKSDFNPFPVGFTGISGAIYHNLVL
jgi:hypothetical protein